MINIKRFIVKTFEFLIKERKKNIYKENIYKLRSADLHLKNKD